MSHLNLAPETAYRPRDDLLDAPMDGSETVILSLSAARYYSLNETGSRIWQRLQNGATLAHLARTLEEGFEVTYEQALVYTHTFVAELVAEGLVQESAAE